MYGCPSAMSSQDENDQALRALFARHAPALGRLVRHYEAEPEARRDLEQEILIALWRAWASFRGECSERTWVYRVAHNVAASHVARALRTRRTIDAQGSAPEPEPPRAPDDVTAERDTVRRLEQRIQTLDLQSRQLVLLALEGCTTAEIVEVTGLSPTNVTTKLSRLRKALADTEEAS
ncbi:RNA polymerase sigma-70 factor, ECF subfamily protein [Minicystis rosea]|nr:RNA polymerase sigma-70 factor, ECF subfamily protein [Minicystis rosea]